jgi:hypothetical protein
MIRELDLVPVLEALEARLLLSGLVGGSALIAAGLFGAMAPANLAATAATASSSPQAGGAAAKAALAAAESSAAASPQVTAQVVGQPGGYSLVGGGRRCVFIPGQQLIVQGTGGDDTITISQTATSITLTTPRGSTDFAGAFSWVTVYGNGGHDTIRIAYSVTASATVYCGDDGSTVYDTGRGYDKVYGGAGNDTIISFGGGASHRVFGGGGTDSLWVDGNTDIPDATAADLAGGYVHQVQQFYESVSMNIGGQSLSDPTASGTYVNYASHPLFTDGPNYSDIRQGASGDCYFVASLAALAYSSPSTISQMITSLGDGTYAVRYYSAGSPVYVRVDADLPTSGGSLVYANFSPTGEMWVPLAEKAYAFFRYGTNSYASLDSGSTSTVLTQVANGYTRTLFTGGTDSFFYNVIVNDLAAGRSVTLNSDSNASGPVIGSHSYAVENAFALNGTMFVTLYNPWGYDGGSDSTSYKTDGTGPGDNNSGDGLVTLTMAQVDLYFQDLMAIV